jgi:N-hydroxyarylamine O-acetyltransferase
MNAHLSPDLVERVLEGFSLSARPTPDLDGLRTLYAAWCRNVPFDNARKLIAVRNSDPGPLPGDSADDFFEHWLAHGVGGTCWAGNGALCSLLDHLGFDARRGLATMMVAPDLPPNHGTVIVNVPEGRYVVDASIMYVEPLTAEADRSNVMDQQTWGVTGRWQDSRFAINWRPLHREDRIDCRIDDWHVDAAQFRIQHEQTRMWSPFNFELTFNLVQDDARLGIAQGRCLHLGQDGLTTLDTHDRVAFLVDHCGISEAMAARIPPDMPTPPPPGSRTAQHRESGREDAAELE